jgi:excisionase family DNA binding protein
MSKMKAKIYDDAMFQGVHEAARITGLSTRILYEGAKSGRFSFVRAGKRMLFNMPALLETLERESCIGGVIID